MTSFVDRRMRGDPGLRRAASLVKDAMSHRSPSRQRGARRKYLVLVTRGLINRDVKYIKKIKATGTKVLGVGKLAGFDWQQFNFKDRVYFFGTPYELYHGWCWTHTLHDNYLSFD